MAEQSDDLLEQLRVLARLLALSIIECKTQVEAIRVLSRTGMDRNEIARTVGTSADVVSVRLAEAKRKTPTKRGTRSRTPTRRGKR